MENYSGIRSIGCVNILSGAEQQMHILKTQVNVYLRNTWEKLSTNDAQKIRSQVNFMLEETETRRDLNLISSYHEINK